MIIIVDESTKRTDDSLQESTSASGRMARALWTSAGTLFLALGIVGIAMPLLPTTPFLLLAAACYLRGSAKMYRWMLTNRYFGEYLEDYRTGKGMPLKIKIATVSLLWTAIALSAIFATSSTIVRIVLVLVAVAVATHILTIKTKRHQSGQV